MEENRTSPSLVLFGFLLFVTVLCLLAASIFSLGSTRSPQDYAEATMMVPATQTALPFAATQMAETNRHQQEINEVTEAGGDALLRAGKVGLGALVIVAVFWAIAGSFRAGTDAVQSVKQMALPASVNLGDGYRMLNDGVQLRILDVRTGASWPLTENMPALPERTGLSKADVLAQAMVDIAKTTGKAEPGDWLGSLWQIEEGYE